MRSRRAALLAALLLSFWSAAQGQSAKVDLPLPPIPDDYFLRDSPPLNVQPVMDEDNRYSDTIGPAGGQLVTLDAAGNTYTLTVPKGALGYPEQLSMVPLSDVKGMPFKKGLNVGVQLEPEGMFFVKPVTLEIAFDKTPDLNSITPFDYTGKGQDFTSTMLERNPGHFVFVLNHFSGVGFGNSTEAERVAELVREPVRAEERINKLVQQQLQPLHERAVQDDALGQPIPEEDQQAVVDAMSRAIEAYKKEVLAPLHDAATQSCTAGGMYIQTVLGVERQVQLTGGEGAVPDDASNAAQPVEQSQDSGNRDLIRDLIGAIMFPHSYKAGEPKQTASQAQATMTLYNTLLEPEQGADGQNQRSVVEKINLKCLDEEAQVCNRTGDMGRLVLWRLGIERTAEISLLGTNTQKKSLVGNNRTDYLDAPFDKAFQDCSHFEVHLSSNLTQKGRSKLDLGFVGGQGTTDYSAQLGTVVPLKADPQADFGTLTFNVIVSRLENGLNSIFLLPYGEKELPYVSYRFSETTQGQAAVLQTESGTKGVTNHCTAQGTGTSPGQTFAALLPVFKPDPDAHDDPDPALDGPSPNMDGLSAPEKRDLIRKRALERILAHTPKAGLLAPPRVLDIEKTLLYLDVGQPTEQATSTCNEDHKSVHQEFATWLEKWKAYWSKTPEVAKPSALGIAFSEEGWIGKGVLQLNPWYDPKASPKALPKSFPLKFSADVPKHEEAGGITYDETWHVDITVVHIPGGSSP